MAASCTAWGLYFEDLLMMDTYRRSLRAFAATLSSILVGTSAFANDPASAQSDAPSLKATSGALVGRLTDAQKMPIAGATVTVVRSDGVAIRATISGSDGVYAFADLPPGAWSISAQIEGLPEVAEPAIAVAPNKATRRDIEMNLREHTP